MRSPQLHLEMHYCHRCGSTLTVRDMPHIFVCENGHTIYANASPAAAVLLFNQQGKVLILARAQNPGKGRLTVPGGFCNGAESIEDGVVREVLEETKIARDAYGPLQFICSGIDRYTSGSEVIPVSAVLFRAQLLHDVVPVLDDENLWATFLDLEEVALD